MVGSNEEVKQDKITDSNNSSKKSMRQRKISFDWRWPLLLIAFTCIFIIALSLNNDHTDNGYTELTRAIDIDDSDSRINWDRYQTVNVELDKTINITQSGTYHLTGELNKGNVVVEAGVGKVRLILDNVTINNPYGPAILCKSADEFVIETTGNNLLSDGVNYSDKYHEDVKGVIYSKADLTFQGNGNLTIESNYQDGIIGKDDLKFKSGTYSIRSIDDAILGKDSVYITGGNFAINSATTSIKTTNTDDPKKGFILIEDGNFDIKSDDKGFKAVNGILINGGNFIIDTYDDAINTNDYIGISGGTFNISSGDDAIHANKKIIIDDGEINVAKSHEGIESQSITINNGTINLIASDDGINAGGKDDQTQLHTVPEIDDSNEKCIISINGGMLYVNSSGDGLDSNGWLYFNGGYTIVDGPTSDNNSALDASIGMVANGGEVLAIGSSNMAKALNKNSLINNISIVFDTPQLTNTKIQIKDSNGNVVLEHTSSKPFNHITASTSRFKQGQDYVIQINNEKQQDFTIHSIVNNVRISNNDNDKEELIMQ